jgi:hypothetical protein
VDVYAKAYIRQDSVDVAYVNSWLQNGSRRLDRDRSWTSSGWNAQECVNDLEFMICLIDSLAASGIKKMKKGAQKPSGDLKWTKYTHFYELL